MQLNVQMNMTFDEGQYALKFMVFLPENATLILYTSGYIGEEDVGAEQIDLANNTLTFCFYNSSKKWSTIDNPYGNLSHHFF